MLTDKNKPTTVTDCTEQVCKVPSVLFKKQGTIWVCQHCNAKYRVEYHFERGAMAGLSSGGNAWVQIG